MLGEPRGARARRRRRRRSRGRGSCAFGRSRAWVAPAGAPYARASSISMAVPDALSFAPGPRPSLSRWAITTIVPGERPTASTTMFCIWTRPRPGIDGAEALGPDRETVRLQLLAEPLRGADRAGDRKRFGVVVDEVRARASSSPGRRRPAGSARGNGVGLATLKAATSSGSPTRSQVPRYSRPLTGRSASRDAPGAARSGAERRPSGL